MKKLSMMLGALLVAASAYAEGYQVNTLSARQLGMGHVGVAMKLGAESGYFNPENRRVPLVLYRELRTT